MEESDYIFATGTTGTKGITEAERAQLLDKLDAMNYQFGINGLWDKEGDWVVASTDDKYVGTHLVNVKGYVDSAIETIKAAKTSKAAKTAYNTAVSKIDAETTYAEMKTNLQKEYFTACGTAAAPTNRYPVDFTMDSASGQYVIPGYADYYEKKSFKCDTYIKPIDLGTSALVTFTDVTLTAAAGTDNYVVDWFFANGFETKTQIESSAAKAAFRAAAVKISNETTELNNGVYDAVDDLNNTGIVYHYEAEGLAEALKNAKITDFEAVYNAAKAIYDFKDNYGSCDTVTLDTPAPNNLKYDTKLGSAVSYYVSANFEKDFDAIKAAGVGASLANKEKIVALATAISEFKSKYPLVKLNANVTGLDLTQELAVIEKDGFAKLQDAVVALDGNEAYELRAADADALTAFETAYNAYKAEFVNDMYAYEAIPISCEAYILAGKANLGLAAGYDEVDNTKLQAYLNNATLSVKSTKLAAKKVKVQAKFSATDYRNIVEAFGKSYTMEYKFYHKAPSKAYKLTKTKAANYITYTSKSLKAGKNYFKVGVVVKDAKGNVVVEKLYNASNAAYRTIK